MNVIGIIAEYNPFHNGHAYQIAHVRKNLHADYIVVATSGDYVQRGEPALLDKYTRARMALSSGADVVLELPVLWSTASAELFADAGISLFEKTGCVNGICFGAESGDLALLRRIADVLADEPADLKASLKHNLKSGSTFPKARESALLSYFSGSAGQDGAAGADDVAGAHLGGDGGGQRLEGGHTAFLCAAAEVHLTEELLHALAEAAYLHEAGADGIPQAHAYQQEDEDVVGQVLVDLGYDGKQGGFDHGFILLTKKIKSRCITATLEKSGDKSSHLSAPSFCLRDSARKRLAPSAPN